MYDFMNVNLDEAKEYTVFPDGDEVEVEVADAEVNEEKKYVLLKLKPKTDAFTRSIRHFLFFPKPDDDPEKVNNKLLMLRDFCKAFGIESFRDPNDLLGHTGWVIVGIEESAEYGRQNTVKRLLARR